MPRFPTLILSCLLCSAALAADGIVPEANLSRLAEGGYAAGDKIRVEGIVLDVFTDEIEPGREFITLNANGNLIYLTRNPKTKCAVNIMGLIGSRLSIVGHFIPNGIGRRSMLGPNLEIAEQPDAILIKTAPRDKFDRRSVFCISNMHQAASAVERFRVEGYPIAILHNRRVLLKTDSNTIVNVKLATDLRPVLNKRIEIVGFPETDLFHLCLNRAIWSPFPGRDLTNAPPEEVSVQNLFTDGKGHRRIDVSFHGRTISISGIIRNLPALGNGDGLLYLECGEFIVPVDASSCPKALDGVSISSRVKCTGICFVETSSWQPGDQLPHVDGLVLVLRSPDDVTVLSQPSWWTPFRLLTVIGVLLALMVAILVWNIALRRVAERRSQELFKAKLRRVESDLKVQERTRLAVELHDTIAQNLTGISMEIDTADQLSGDRAQMTKHLHAASRTLQSCRDELRNCLWDLQSRALDEPDMNVAIHKTLEPLTTDANLVIRFNVPRTRLSDNTAHELMRIIRELVANAIRHGCATNIRVAGKIEGNRLLFSVRDDGMGFDPDNRPGLLQGHFGLHGVRERVNQFSGELNIESSPGKGSRISISLDLPAEGQKL